MGKKNKDQEPVANLGAVANRDIVQRINFLYQASTYLSSISQSLPDGSGNVESQQPASTSNRKGKKKKKLRHPKTTSELSRSYVGTMRIVGQKSMVRMDPSVKRTLCKGCDNVLTPGLNATVRVRPLASHGQAVVHSCLICGTSRRIPAPPLLDPDAPAPGNTAKPAVTSTSSAEHPTCAEKTLGNMDVDVKNISASGGSSRAAKPRKKGIPRLPPLFERKGHVVFRGNERLPDETRMVQP